MSRSIDRLLGKEAGSPLSFATRPYGMSAAEAEAAAAAAASVPLAPGPRDAAGLPVPGTQNSGTVAATTGAAGSKSNLTTGGALP